MHSLTEISLMALFAIAIALVFFILPKSFVVLYFFIKPILDRGSTFTSAFGRHVGAIALPLASFVYVIFMNSKWLEMPYKTLIILNQIILFIGFLRFGEFSIEQISFYMRVCLPYLLFFSIPIILSDRKKIVDFYKASCFSGLFTLILILAQKFGILSIDINPNDILSIDGKDFNRVAGGYWDAFSAAMPMISSLFSALFLIQVYFESKIKTVLLIAMVCGYLIGLMFTFHRMSLVVVSVVITTWLILNNRSILILIFVLIIGLNSTMLLSFIPKLYYDIEIVRMGSENQAFSKNENLEIEDHAFHGRGWLWSRFLKKFSEGNIIEILFGIAWVGRATHNDYLRVLLNYGIIGLLFHLILMLRVVLLLIRIFLATNKNKDNWLKQLSLTAIFFWTLYILGGITLNVGTLSTVTWYFWITSGLAIFQWYQFKCSNSNSRVILDNVCHKNSSNNNL